MYYRNGGNSATVNPLLEMENITTTTAQQQQQQRVIEVEKFWHKANDKNAMTYAQLEYINALGTGSIEGWEFPSSSQAIRRITKDGASDIISALKSGYLVKLV